MSKPIFSIVLRAGREDIDELGHVNNAVWVRWIQQIAVSHWDRVALPKHKGSYYWVVVRHEIDYLRPAYEGDRVIARTWVGDKPQGARFERFVEFINSADKTCVRARTQWAIIDKALGRPIRVPREVVAPFLAAV